MAEMRLIDANALDFAPDDKNVMNGVLFVSSRRGGGRTLALVQTTLKAMIDRAPTIDAVPVVHARWDRVYEDWRRQMAGNKCSACGFVLFGPVGSYCPRCGAKMDGGDPDGVAGTSGP